MLKKQPIYNLILKDEQILKMQERKNQPNDFKNQLEQHDEYKVLLQKLSLLKDGLRKERQITQNINLQIVNKEKACEQLQYEIIWKDDMNQVLKSEVSSILNQILQVRARKRRQKLLQQLRNLSSDNQSGPEGAKSIETSQN